MQPRTIFVVLALSAVPGAWASFLGLTPEHRASFLEAASSSAELQAKRFLAKFGDQPIQHDQLLELKSENPEAYALVNALLTKKRMGLLNMKRPNAGFAPGDVEEQPAAPEGPGVFTDMLRPGELEAAHIHHDSTMSLATKSASQYESVQPSTHNWFNWKRHDDDQMVQNVLASVDDVKGGKKTGLLDVESPPATDALQKVLKEEDNKHSKKGALRNEKPPQAAPKADDASYMTPTPVKAKHVKKIDSSSDTPPTASGKRTSQVQASSRNYLASFSWDESIQKSSTAAEAKAGAKVPKLMAWLGDSTPLNTKAMPKANEVEPMQRSRSEPAEHVNRYMMDLN